MSRLEETLREVVETLAPLKRRAGSADERRAAEWLAERLRQAGARDARVEDTPFRDGYATLLLPLNAIAMAAGLAALRQVNQWARPNDSFRVGAAAGAAQRPSQVNQRARPNDSRAALVALSAGLLIADDASNLTRVWRTLTQRPKTTTNVIAETGDAASDRTLVVLAHHDAAPTGAVFDQRPQKWLAQRFPELVAKTDTSFPLWWPVVGGPLAIAAGAATGNRKVLKAGLAAGAGMTALALDIARNRIVPGANDNLSACAALVAMAEEGEDLPVRVVLASCGAEEVLQGGIYGFVADHLSELPQDRTWVLNLDTIGSPELFMLEGEGTFVMEDYCDPAFRDQVAASAETALGTPLRRGCRARSSTDSVVTHRAGYATACLCSWEPENKCLSNYHLMSDTPDNLRYDTVAQAVRVTTQLARDLA